MKHVLWVSRHSPTPEMIRVLAEILDDQDLIFTKYDKSITRHEELLQTYQDGEFDDIVVTLPMDMIGKLCKAGIHPIKAVHEMTGIDDMTNLRNYKFLRFERIHSVIVKKTRLKKEERS